MLTLNQVVASRGAKSGQCDWGNTKLTEQHDHKAFKKKEKT
jgi:hypothetical protein